MSSPGNEVTAEAHKADRVAAVLLFRRDGALLLQHRDNKPNLPQANMWVPPGGHAEPGESTLACAHRELLEETEYASKDLRFHASFDVAAESEPAHQLTIYWCWYDDVQPVVCHEGQALAFIERSKAANYPIPAFVINIWDTALAVINNTIKEIPR